MLIATQPSLWGGGKALGPQLAPPVQLIYGKHTNTVFSPTIHVQREREREREREILLPFSHIFVCIFIDIQSRFQAHLMAL